MICRMTLEQRCALSKMIGAVSYYNANPTDDNLKEAREATEKFHQVFANEDESADKTTFVKEPSK